MECETEEQLTVTCRQAGEAADWLARATRGGQEFVERVQLEGAYERVCFAGRALRHFGMEPTAERLAELDLQLARAPLEAKERQLSRDESPIIRVSGFKRRQLEWLWPGRIARGAITLVVGDPGLGKSLITLDIAARVSRGMNWPDGVPALGGPASVVLLSGEDDMEVTIRPRLEVLEADCDRIATVAPQGTEWDGR